MTCVYSTFPTPALLRGAQGKTQLSFAAKQEIQSLCHTVPVTAPACCFHAAATALRLPPPWQGTPSIRHCSYSKRLGRSHWDWRCLLGNECQRAFLLAPEGLLCMAIESHRSMLVPSGKP